MLCKLDANLVKIFQITSGFSDNFTEIDKNQLKAKEKALQKTNLKQGFSKRRRWYHQESNRGHTDFQSVALPTELWHHWFCLRVQRYNFLFYYFDTSRYFCLVLLFFNKWRLLSRFLRMDVKRIIPWSGRTTGLYIIIL